MPGRVIAVAVAERGRLLVAFVPRAVVATMGEIDAAGECDVVVGGGLRGPLHHDDLLVVAPATTDPVVEHELTAGVVDDARQAQVVELAGRMPDRMRAPEETSHGDAASGGVGEHGADLGPRAGETLVAIALEVGEVQPVTGARRTDVVEQAREVLGAVDEHSDVVAVRPGLAAAAVDGRARVPPLLRGEEPAFGARVDVRHERAERQVNRTCRRTTVSVPNERSWTSSQS